MFGLRQVVRLARNISAQDVIKFRHASASLKTYSTNKLQQKDDHLDDVDKSSNQTNDLNKSINSNDKEENQKVLTKIEPKLHIIFTCKKCNTQNSKTMSKLAYEKGVVIIRCDGCKNNHLIADNLGWFNEFKKGINIEKILAEKGETVCKIKYVPEGFLVVPKEEGKNIDESKNEWSNQKENENLDESKNDINSKQIKDT
ncbi:PREDICTED: mitochondrial protein import protein ZIM17-like [Polistes dominula]|uniref:Mitochondrial protein import protein ZIM17-like n=1 Tax=Polistes dominula TaxID=743375 RepID=A0ABM1HZA4_POLDO|nr:PREDICTED: mitochondrial protein import protein ZIM17-like [Polistes dominula]